MATMEIKGFGDVYNALERCAESGKICMRAVEAAAPYLLDATRKTINSTKGGGNNLARSFEATKVRNNAFGAYVTIRPVGKDKNGWDWISRAAYLEYGTVWPRKEADAAKIHHPAQAGQPKNTPQPWRDRSLNAARSGCEEKMRQTVFAEIDKIWT